MLPPRLNELGTIPEQVALGVRLMRFTCIANALDLPSISLPVPTADGSPGGIMLTGLGTEERLLRLAQEALSALH